MRITILIAIILGATAFVSAKTTSLTAEVMVKGYDIIWSMAQVDADKILFLTRKGQFNLLNINSKKVDLIKSDLKIFHQGQGGLLDLEVRPDFKKNKKAYFTYSCEKLQSQTTTCLGTGILDISKFALTDIKEIFSVEPAVDSNLHFGSRLAWDSKHNLYMTTGDRYLKKDSAQSLETHLGKILRLDENGKAAIGNPFIDNKIAKPEIWSLGHRNMQGLFYDLKTESLWEHEHGAKGDEINKIQAGKNYGWPIITHGVDYNGEKIGIGKEKAGLEQPLHTYVPSIAPSALIVYSGKKFKQWQGHLFIGALAGEHINHVEIQSPVKETRLFTDLDERVRDIIEFSTGDIYFSTDSGKIFKFNF